MRKYLKITFALFILCSVFSVYGLSADEKHAVLGVTLPALKGNYETDWITKLVESNQKYTNNGAVLSDGTYVDINVNLHKTAISDSWQSLTRYETRVWNTYNYVNNGTYRIEIEQKDSRLKTASHSGLWTYVISN